MSDSCRPRKLEAGLQGRYSMSSVLITSTMKSDPAFPAACGNSLGVSVSAAATTAEGRTAEGRAALAAASPSGCAAGEAALASGGETAVAAPATATPARNLR